jgi:hypothetical protein
MSSDAPDARGGPDTAPPDGGTQPASMVESRPQATVEALFESLNLRGREPSLGYTSGVYEFDIEGSGRWFLHLSEGHPLVESEETAPDCVIACDTDDFIEIAEGRRNLVTAFLSGKVECNGDLALAVAFRRLLPVTK